MKLCLIVVLLLFVFMAPAGVFCEEETLEQEMRGFSLSGFSQQGKKTWQVSGSAANILAHVVYLNDITAHMYGEQDNLTLIAQKGRYDKKDSLIHLEQDVVATTESGARLTTDSLDWLQNPGLIRTDDRVVIDKQGLFITAYGLRAKPDFKIARLLKDAHVTLEGQSQGQATVTTIICVGPLEVDYQKQVAIFNRQVVVNNKDGQIKADRIKAYFDFKNKQLKKIIASGHVEIVRQGNIAYSSKAVYFPDKKILELSGRPKIILYETKSMGEMLNAPSGN
jgi:LPS export ABC transporter protein LptC